MSVCHCCRRSCRWWVLVLFVVAVVGLTTSQTAYECPEDWYTYKDHCYKFEAANAASYDEAWKTCSMYGAGVLHIDSMAENTFIANWLLTRDPYPREWYTSGVVYSDMRSGPPRFAWQSTGLPVDSSLSTVWLSTPRQGQKGTIIYKMEGTRYGWALGNPVEKRQYVCKISRNEAYRIHFRMRGEDYGLAASELESRESGPHFLVKPESVIVVIEEGRRTKPVALQCVVQSKPTSVLKWYKGEFMETPISSANDKRYEITNGKLQIIDPTQSLDADFYTCTAENKFGLIRSERVEISFGSLGDFNSVADAGSTVSEYDGAQLQCSQISYKPAISYQWVKGDFLQFVRPQYQSYIFISNNGKLYFSEVTNVDQSNYTCIAALRGINQYKIDTRQPPMRNSLPIPLIVLDQSAKAAWGPVIQNEFIAVYPSPPLHGYDVRMECFAYGSLSTPFYYTWSRDDGREMPQNAQMKDHNRVLLIKNARIEDAGVYRCSVNRGDTGDSKTIDLVLSGKPYFVGPLMNQRADVGSQLTWICGARGNPSPTYTWYRNGQRLVTNKNLRVIVQNNVLTISDLDGNSHDGMYQCAASNAMGTSMSTAQLTVLSFPPNFDKNPVSQKLISPESGDVSLPCQPEGAPHPQIAWDKNGQAIQLDNDKYKLLGTGNLRISNLEPFDEGTYSCTASNIFGEAKVSTTLRITGGATITIPVTADPVIVNQTQLLRCEASFPKGLDMIYEWSFNGYPLDPRDDHYKTVDQAGSGIIGLYVVSAQRKHEGQYTCTARTPFNAASSSAYLQVKGPPRQPAGLRVPSKYVTKNSSQVMWTEGSNSGGTLTHHIIQMANEFEPDDWEDALVISLEESKDETVNHLSQRHAAVVGGLNPGTSYRFRILALNSYGRGVPSESSMYVRTISAPPAVAPRNVRGGGGSVGLLTILWDPLHPSEYGGSPVKYQVYWRRKESKNTADGGWAKRNVTEATTGRMVELVNVDNFYRLYDVKVQAFNNLGMGPNTTMVSIYSAEGMPAKSPENVQMATYNSTAIHVTWQPVPDDRLNVRGKIKGYQINYWNIVDDPEKYFRFIRYYGQRDNGMVIGLEENVDMVMDVQVFNTAGLGPRSNKFVMETSGYAPLTYPQEVRVSSAGMNKVHVWWRGITMTVDEEALSGFAIWVWVATEEFSSARMVDIEEIVFEYTVDDIEEGFVYALRLAAVGGGGYGVKTPTVYFTMEGQIVIDSNFAQTIDIYLSTSSPCRVSTPLIMFLSIISLSSASLINRG